MAGKKRIRKSEYSPGRHLRATLERLGEDSTSIHEKTGPGDPIGRSWKCKAFNLDIDVEVDTGGRWTVELNMRPEFHGKGTVPYAAFLRFLADHEEAKTDGRVRRRS